MLSQNLIIPFWNRAEGNTFKNCSVHRYNGDININKLLFLRSVKRDLIKLDRILLEQYFPNKSKTSRLVVFKSNLCKYYVNKQGTDAGG